MGRLRTESSRSYLGRSAPRAVYLDDDKTRIGSTGIPRPSAVASCPLRVEERGSNVIQAHSATRSNAGRDDAEVSSGHSSDHGVRSCIHTKNEALVSINLGRITLRPNQYLRKKLLK